MYLGSAYKDTFFAALDWIKSEDEGGVPDLGYGGNSPLKCSRSRTWTNSTPADGYTFRSPWDLDKMVTTKSTNLQEHSLSTFDI